MFKKLFVGFTVMLSIFVFGFVERGEAAASISPSTQTIYGSQVYANWTFSWTGTPPFKVLFRSDSSSPYEVINASSNSNSMSYSYKYSSSEAYKKYTPGLLVEDTNGHLHVASATVYKYLTKP